MNRRYVEHAALVSGGPAWLISRILTSPHVVKLLNHPPAWIERGDLADTVNAIHQAGRAFSAASTAHERGKHPRTAVPQRDHSICHDSPLHAVVRRVVVRRSLEPYG